jgi:transcription initiation factor TFIIIB Brf1 subunit/transcription initiation factor TFIIB
MDLDLLTLVSIQDVIQRFCTNMCVSRLVAVTATHTIKEIDKRGMCQSRLISSVAGAAIFISCLVCNTDVDTDTIKLLKTVSMTSGAADATIKVFVQCICATIIGHVHHLLITNL